jgi:DNA-directed RNA polymerase subunit RPC12/RpoP
MGTVVLKFVPEDRIGDREIIDTGVMMLGLGGDNVHCGLCGREMMHEVPIRDMKVNMLYRCAGCGSLNEIPADA